MSDTTRFSLPLLQAAQAQKHVTVNDALTRLDGLMQLSLKSATIGTPPQTPQDGDAYGVGPSAVNAWAGQEGAIALFVNGGWVFVPARLGMRAFIADQGGWAAHDGTDWIIGQQTLSANGAGMQFKVREIDHTIGIGATSSVPYALPGQAVVYGITGRVLSEVTGTATGYSVGVTASLNRYGSGLSLAADSWMRGLTGTPMTYYGDENLILTAEGGDFAGGEVRFAIHYAQFALPAS